jgi:putative peptidoglycan lipid II flippase
MASSPGRSKNSGESSTRMGGHFRLVTFATSVSRVSGYFRDTLNATLFGAGWISDAYFMAIRIPSLFRDLFAEGALSNAFVPALTERLKKNNRKEAWALMSQVFSLLLIAVGVLTSLGILFAPLIVDIIAHGFKSDPNKFQLTVELTRILFPFLLFVSFAALWMGTLNSLYRFTIPAFAPVFMNLTQIIVGVLILLFWKGESPEAELRNIRLWAISMTLGFLLQWLVQVPAAWKEGVKLRWAWPPNHPGVREMLRLMGPAVISQAVLQFNLLVNQFFASFLAAGYVTYLYYGNRLFQLPFGILGVSIATVVFPLLSRQSGEGKEIQFSETLSRALSVALFLMIPCTLGIWIVAEPACRLAFQYGRFSPEATLATAQATALYALGLIGYTGVKILLPAFYAKGNTRKPVTASIVAMATNLGLNLAVFMFFNDSRHRFWGLALASGLGATVNLALLLNGLAEIRVLLQWRLIGREAGKAISASLLMGAVAWILLTAVRNYQIPGGRLTEFIIPVLAGIFVYLWLTKIMKSDGLTWILEKKRRGHVSE